MKGLVFTAIIILLVIGGTVLSILNVQNIIPGLWSGIFGVLSSALGILLALFELPKLSLRRAGKRSLQKKESLLELPNIDKDKGAIVVYTRKHLRGSTINLCRGFTSVNLKPEKAASVVERPLDSQGTALIAIFTLVEPGNYTIYSESQEFIAKVTVDGGVLVEIDWR